ncbi:MAG TPA: NosD domain-containing protein, partial [Azospira sp.]|nr:NosD domain-containing protein [Azospira sp.]
GVRLWYSKNNLLEGNEIEDSRDMVAWYSDHNVFRNNVSRRSRYSIHFMFANDNVVEGNSFYDNAVGVYLMYTNGVVVRNNLISHATGATGMAVGLKESSNTVIEGNEILYCSTGIGTDLSPFEPGSKTEVRGNRFAFNGIAVSFVSDREGNEFEANVFEGNLADVAVAGGGGAAHNLWRGNHWDAYQGFDRNRDGIGDTPFELYAYADRLWMEVPFALFFKSAPMMESLDFLERLAPFSDPVLMVRDEAPVFKNPRRNAK